MSSARLIQLAVGIVQTVAIVLTTGCGARPDEQPLIYQSIQEAAYRGDLADVKRHLARGAAVNERAGGADMNATTVPGRTPLYEAARGGHLAVVKYLVAKGADVNVEDASGNGATPLDWANSGGHEDVSKYLISKGAHGGERALRTSVKNNMHVVQTSIEAFAIDHNGNYPDVNASWETGSVTGMTPYFPGGDPIGSDGTAIPGNLPTNPYSGEPYKYGTDLFYFPTRLAQSGDCGMVSEDDNRCPFGSIAAPSGIQGTIVIIGFTREGDPHPQEYAIVGFGRDTTEPMYDIDPSRNSKIYFALHN